MSVLQFEVNQQPEMPVSSNLPQGYLALIMLGPPGVGKGTQAERLASIYGIPSISTGAIFRAEMTAGTPLGLEIQETMVSGRLVEDSVVCNIVNKRLKEHDCSNGFILDGFPRTLPQAKLFKEQSEADNIKLRAVINFVCDDEELIRRILERAATSKVKRPEDTEEIFRDRLAIYRRETEPLIPFYKDMDLLYTVDATRSIDEINVEIREFLDKVIPLK